MSDQHDRAGSVLADVAQNLGGIFRHMLPGVLVVVGARLAHPSWFQGINLQSWQHLAALAVLTIAVGNTWFAFNRYGLHQVVDYVLYCIGSRGPARADQAWTFLDDLGVYTYRSLHTPDTAARARQHVAFRASTVLLILTTGELAILAGLWHGNDSVLRGHSTTLFVGGAVALVIGVWQMVITRRIDYYVVCPPA